MKELRESIKEMAQAVRETAILMYSVSPRLVVMMGMGTSYLAGVTLPAWTGLLAIGIVAYSIYKFQRAIHRKAMEEVESEGKE